MAISFQQFGRFTVVSVAIFFAASFALHPEPAVPGGWYRHFSGTLTAENDSAKPAPPLKIHIDLMRSARVAGDEGGYEWSAFYYYDTVGVPIPLHVSEDDPKKFPNALRMLEQDENERPVAELVVQVRSKVSGDARAEYVLSGAWTAASGKKKYRLEAAEDFSRSARFNLFEARSKETPAGPAVVNKPATASVEYYEADFALGYLQIHRPPRVAAPGGASATYDRLEQTIGRAYFQKHYRPGDPAEAARGMQREYYTAFRAEAREARELKRESYFWEWMLGSSIVWNDRDVLAYEISTYEFRGGAHGIGNLQYVVLDLQTGARLTLDSILKPGVKKKTLGARIEAAYAKRSGVAFVPGQNMQTLGLLVDRIPVTENFFVSPAGITFVYNVYEIQSYVEGPAAILIPFSDLDDLLKPGTAIDRLRK